MPTTFIAIASAKGGVGKTTTAINLASALNHFAREVILIDCNLEKPNVGLYLGLTNTPINIHTVLRGQHSIHEAMYKHPSGLLVIPGHLAIEENLRPISERQISDAFASLLNKAEIVLVDTASGIGAETQKVIRGCDSVILVTTPDIVSVTDTLKTASLARSFGKKILGIVVTHLREKTYDMPLIEVQSTLQAPIIGTIRYDEQIHAAHAVRYPVVYTNHETNATKDYRNLAANLIGEPFENTVSDKESFFLYLLQRIGILQPKR